MGWYDAGTRGSQKKTVTTASHTYGGKSLSLVSRSNSAGKSDPGGGKQCCVPAKSHLLPTTCRADWTAVGGFILCRCFRIPHRQSCFQDFSQHHQEMSHHLLNFLHHHWNFFHHRSYFSHHFQNFRFRHSNFFHHRSNFSHRHWNLSHHHWNFFHHRSNFSHHRRNFSHHRCNFSHHRSNFPHLLLKVQGSGIIHQIPLTWPGFSVRSARRKPPWILLFHNKHVDIKFNQKELTNDRPTGQ